MAADADALIMSLALMGQASRDGATREVFTTLHERALLWRGSDSFFRLMEEEIASGLHGGNAPEAWLTCMHLVRAHGGGRGPKELEP